jgi:SAM-dependent methyltransferase
MADPSWRELNRAMWDERVPLHVRSSIYDVPNFKASGLSLRPHEIEDLGDVTGKELIHLQCHFGQDTLSWARLGANVTGLDFSEPAIRAAIELAAEIGVHARFVTSDVYDAPEAVGGHTFDIVYTGVGALCWLPDMTQWAKVVFELLRPGGELYLYEFHPLKWIFGEADRPEILDTYFPPPEGVALGGVTYAAAKTTSASDTTTIQWNHSLGEVVTALAEAGLHVLSLRELDGDVVRQWPMMVRGVDRMYRMPPGTASLPLMYVLRAIRYA